MPSGLYYLNRSCQTEGLKITYLIFCGRMPEVRNAGTRENIVRTPEKCRAESEDGEQKSEERPKYSAQRVIFKLWSISSAIR